MPLNLFDAVAQNDYEGMISIWATGCNRALLSISRLKRAPYRRSSEAVEEKRDEVMQQHGTTSQSFHVDRGLDGDIEVALQEIEIVLSSLVDDNVKPSSLSTDHMELGSESDFHRFRLQNRHHAMSSAPRIPFFPSLYNSSPIRRGSIWSSLTKCSSREQVDSFLFEKARSISNLRPNASFVINLDNGAENNGNEGALFDGAIANATPLGNYSSGGGVGTILHLACALDLPFALAMLLIMGADASARHTAFRRLMLHEAACSNSPKCLRLLLEMGQQHYSDLIAKGISVAGLNYTPLWNAESSKSQIISDVKQSGLKSDGNTNISTRNTNKHMDFSYPEILCICQKYAQMVKNNHLSDYDAAVALMSEVSISDQNKYFIASTCRVHFDDINTSDGHGNTALHWAAFKNSYSCSELLLKYQSNVNAKATSSGWTPLHDAAYSESIETLSLLITAGADANAKASSGASPLCFAAQEDAPTATRLLLQAGADPTLRCCDEESVSIQGSNYSLNRFSGYTPLHYAAHYNSQKAARVLLEYHSNVLIQQEKNLLEISDLNDKLPIHIAVARGSSDVLRELLHYGARVDTRPTRSISMSSSVSDDNDDAMDGILTRSNYRTQSFDEQMEDAEDDHDAVALSPTVTSASILPSSSFRLVTPVSSPVLRSMIPQVPVESVKPWNCISQRSIDECRLLIQEAESSWSPDRHALFHPRDRAAVLELLRVGKRLEQQGTGIFIDLWPLVLSFCGRGWFEPESDHPQLDASFPFPLPSI
jgi:ankyrin repeat protein